jgi:hypothetical protein
MRSTGRWQKTIPCLQSIHAGMILNLHERLKQCTHCQHFRQHFEQHVDLGDVGENVVSVYRAEALGNMLCTCCPTCCEININ